jgi:uncharacterized membrane protein
LPDGVRCFHVDRALVLSLAGSPSRVVSVPAMIQAALAALCTALACSTFGQPLLAAGLAVLALGLGLRAVRPLVSRERIELSCDDIVVRSWSLGGRRTRSACLTSVGVYEPGLFGVRSTGAPRIGSTLGLDAETRQWIADCLNQRLGALRGWR